MSYKYREAFLNEFSRHGIVPRGNTPPELIHEFINSLYLFEIRALKRRVLDGAVAKPDYARQVESLRNRYPVLAVPVRLWLESE
ncbi:MAG TPA: hypothetical protein VLM38_09780 [Blastocatellia bacterium]|nr:hypothetical protein [Blastocatellia bacterium]